MDKGAFVISYVISWALGFKVLKYLHGGKMIKHIVTVKLKDQSKIEELNGLFAELKTEIKVIKKLECEQNIYLNRETNYDVVYNVYFDSITDMEAYLVDECHLKVATRLQNEFAESLAIIDVKC